MPTPTAGTNPDRLVDLRVHPLWAPIHGTITVAGWDISLWEEPSVPGEPNMDSTLIACHGDTVRLATLDPAVNVLHGTAAPRVAARGSHALRSALQQHGNLQDAFSAAAREVIDPDLRPRHRNPLVACSVVDLTEDGADAYRSADSEVWVKRAGTWSAVFAEDMLTPSSRRDWEEAARRAAKDPSAQWSAQEELLDDPTAWNCPTFGLTPDPRPAHAHLDAVDEIIVSTDGARLTAARCGDLHNWLSRGIQRRRLTTPTHRSPHGDIALLHARRSVP